LGAHRLGYVREVPTCWERPSPKCWSRMTPPSPGRGGSPAGAAGVALLSFA